jgi:hypothetical protein
MKAWPLTLSLLLGVGLAAWWADDPADPEPGNPAEQGEPEPLPVAPLPVGKISIGGPTGPDGTTEVACDLPVEQRTRNVGGRDGAGLCVFSSIGQAARWQNETRLVNFQSDMRKELGGGYPAKVDRMIARYGAGTPYLQYEGCDTSLLKMALETGRMPSVTYNGHDPHYSGTIAHMVNLIHLDERWAVVLDNNFVGENELVWLTPEEFRSRWCGSGSGWAVILLAPPPPPIPHLREE